MVGFQVTWKEGFGLRRGVRVGVALISSILLLSGCAPLETIQGLFSAEEEQQEESLAENQSVLYGKVTRVVGNEITISVGTLKQQRASGEGGPVESPQIGQSGELAKASQEDTESVGIGLSKTSGTSRRKNNESDGSVGKGKSTGNTNSEQAEEDSASTENGPDAEEDAAQAQMTGRLQEAGADRVQPSDSAGSVPDGMPSDAQGTGGQRSGARVGMTQLELTGEERTITIPVGTEVTAANVTRNLNFTSIAVDNSLKLILQKMEDGSEVVVSVTIL